MRILPMALQPLLGILFVVPSAEAQEVDVGGQVRPRFEFRDTSSVGNSNFTSMRARGEISARLDKGVSIMFQVQDVRIWGEETSTILDFSANQFDLHQGYLDVASSGSVTYAARIGRQEINLGGQRLVGAEDWTQQGRAFDALRLSADGSLGRVDLLAAVIANDVTPEHEDTEYFWGLHGQLERGIPGTIDVYGFLNDVGTLGTEQYTVGGRWWGRVGVLEYRAEGSYQTGDRMGDKVSAFMLGGRIGLLLLGGDADFVLWYDYLSGDDDPADNEIKVFDTLFATNHKFYGLADLFVDIPQETAGRGLQDAAIKSGVNVGDDARVAAEFHSFWLAQDQGLSTPRLGEELDVTLSYRLGRHLTVWGGYAGLFVQDALGEIGRLTDNVNWFYVMVDASL
jgi:hypothetical protein